MVYGDYDITGKIGQLVGPEDGDWFIEWPMWSFDRPASILWNAIAERLHEAGWSDKRIKQWLQSKETRWALDGILGDKIIDLGREYAEAVLANQ